MSHKKKNMGFQHDENISRSCYKRVIFYFFYTYTICLTSKEKLNMGSHKKLHLEKEGTVSRGMD